jgi:hypothetical protein
VTDDQILELVDYVARKPSRAPQFMARVLKRSPTAVEADLEVAVERGWLDGEEGCCGAGWRYRITDAGQRVLHENGA